MLAMDPSVVVAPLPLALAPSLALFIGVVWLVLMLAIRVLATVWVKTPRLRDDEVRCGSAAEQSRVRSCAKVRSVRFKWVRPEHNNTL